MDLWQGYRFGGLRSKAKNTPKGRIGKRGKTSGRPIMKNRMLTVSTDGAKRD